MKSEIVREIVLNTELIVFIFTCLFCNVGDISEIITVKKNVNENLKLVL